MRFKGPTVYLFRSLFMRCDETGYWQERIEQHNRINDTLKVPYYTRVRCHSLWKGMKNKATMRRSEHPAGGGGISAL